MPCGGSSINATSVHAPLKERRRGTISQTRVVPCSAVLVQIGAIYAPSRRRAYPLRPTCLGTFASTCCPVTAKYDRKVPVNSVNAKI